MNHTASIKLLKPSGWEKSLNPVVTAEVGDRNTRCSSESQEINRQYWKQRQIFGVRFNPRNWNYHNLRGFREQSDCTVQRPICPQTPHREGNKSWCTRDMAVLSWRNRSEAHMIVPSEWDQHIMSKLNHFGWLTVVLKNQYTCSLELYFPGCISTCSAQALKLKKIKICQLQQGQGET